MMMRNQYCSKVRETLIVPKDSGHSSGFTLIELMIAMVAGLVLLAALYSFFIFQNKELKKQEQITEMQQNARMAMEIISRDLMMAGYGPGTMTRCTGTTPTVEPSSPYSCLGIVVADPNFVSFSRDLNYNGVLTDKSENLTYDRYQSPSGSGKYALGRKSNKKKEPVVDNISALSFTYLPATGTTGTSNLGDIRRIQISITTKTANVDPDTGNYRYFTLTSTVTPRNLMLSDF